MTKIKEQHLSLFLANFNFVNVLKSIGVYLLITNLVTKHSAGSCLMIQQALLSVSVGMPLGTAT